MILSLLLGLDISLFFDMISTSRIIATFECFITSTLINFGKGFIEDTFNARDIYYSKLSILFFYILSTCDYGVLLTVITSNYDLWPE